MGHKIVYLGDTARTCFDRGLEHLGALKSSNSESPLVEHCYDQHDGVLQEFRMKVLNFPKTTMLRQCKEGHEIGKLEHGTYMNRKGEWGQNLPPQIDHRRL